MNSPSHKKRNREIHSKNQNSTVTWQSQLLCTKRLCNPTFWRISLAIVFSNLFSKKIKVFNFFSYLILFLVPIRLKFDALVPIHLPDRFEDNFSSAFSIQHRLKFFRKPFAKPTQSRFGGSGGGKGGVGLPRHTRKKISSQRKRSTPWLRLLVCCFSCVCIAKKSSWRELFCSMAAAAVVVEATWPWPLYTVECVCVCERESAY